jgi:hypothetical protein
VDGHDGACPPCALHVFAFQVLIARMGKSQKRSIVFSFWEDFWGFGLEWEGWLTRAKPGNCTS